jgi:hypothetical protein
MTPGIMNSLKKKWPYPYIFMLCIAFSAVYWKGKQKEFPYTGTWVHDEVRSNGRKFKTILVISKDERCSLTIIGIDKNQLQCTYIMRDGGADLTCQAAITSPGWSDMKLVNRITPVDGGQKIRLESRKVILINQKTGARKETETSNDITLHKLNNR